MSASLRASLNARPQEVELDTAETAVLVIDMQNDFAAEGGLGDLVGNDIAPARATIGPIARVCTTARAAGIPVVHLQHGYLPDLSDLGPARSKNRIAHDAVEVGRRIRTPDGGEGRLLVHGTWNTEILPELAPEPTDVVVRKNRYSGFYGTELDAVLRRLGVANLVVTGCTTSVCVESTVRDAMFRDYVPVVLEDCTSEPMSRANHDASLAVIERNLGWVADSEGFLRAIETAAAR